MKEKSGNIQKFSFSTRRSLGFRLVLWFFSVSVLPLIIIPVVGTVITKKSTGEAARKMLSYSFHQKQEQINKYFDQLMGNTLVESQLDFTVLMIREIARAADKPGTSFTSFSKTTDYRKIIAPAEHSLKKMAEATGVYDIILADTRDRVIYSLKKEVDLGKSLGENELGNTILGEAFRAAKSTRATSISNIGRYSFSGDKTYFFIVNPLTDGDTIAGYMAFQISIDSIEDMLFPQNKLGETASAYLVDDNMSIIASSDTDLPAYRIFSRASNIQAEKVLNKMRSGMEINIDAAYTVSEYRNENGSEVLGLSMPVTSLMKYHHNFVLVQEIKADEAYGASSIIIIIMLPLVGIILLIVIISAFLLIRMIVKPINQLSVWADAVAQGDLSYMEIRTVEDEIGRVKSGFTSVVDSFRELADVSEAMSVGDFEKTVAVRGPDDRLGKSVNEMLASFKSVIAEATRISKGDYSGDIRPRSDKDSLGKALQVMTKTLRENSLEMQSQDWLKSGMAELSMKLSGDKSIKELTQELIKFLVKYLDAQMGLFYLSDQEEMVLTATYAFSDRKGNFSRLKPGEGLVGQAALEKEIILFRDITENAPCLNSGVDEKIPPYFIIAPLVHENQIAGVIQIGKLESFTPLERKFIEQVLGPASISLNTSTSRAKVKQLLEQTQQQAERLQVQQEELRQTNEELEEQTKALRSSEEALQAQQEELRVINEELQERTKALEQQRDDVRIKNKELEKARNEIEEKAKDLEFASKYKSEFLANMSHELRTPLNSIIVLSQLLSENKKQNLTDKQIEYASTINSSGSDLLDLINEILDLSKIEAGHIDLHPETVELTEMLNQMDLFFRPMIERKGLDFSMQIDENVPSRIFIDNQRLQQILKNLLSNAVKFTEKGTIKIEARRPAGLLELKGTALDPATSIEFKVIDTGIGIPKDKLKIIFEAFQQADGTTSRRFGGTGLGLTISRSFAQVMGGDIRLISEEGKGSEFILLLPEKYEEKKPNLDGLKPAQKAAIQAPAGQKPHQAKAIANENPANDHRDIIQKGDKVLLIIEDDPAFAKILFDMAEEKGYKCLSARDGESGLYLADLHVPSAIVLDIGLPGIDGWEVMERLHQDAKTRHIPVHFISAMDKSREALQMGAIGYLTKPVSIDKLRDAFGRIEDVISRPMKKLLIVDDDLIVQKSIMNLIGNGDVTTTAVKSGAEAYRLLEKENFDCLILDLGLEDMSGFDVIEKIRANNKLSGLPIIIYTGSDLSREEEERLQKYADSIIIKGIRSPERLLAETSLFLHRVEANLPKEKQEMIRMMYNQEDVFNDRTILLVDDDPRNVFAIRSVLEERGLKVIPAGNGREGIEKLKENKEINLVLMDVMMPEMDGYEATGLIRKMPQYANLPIIALTAKAMKEDRDNCIEAGANDYLSKPVDSQKLLSLLRVWLYK